MSKWHRFVTMAVLTAGVAQPSLVLHAQAAPSTGATPPSVLGKGDAVSADELDIMRSEIDLIMERAIRHIESGSLEGQRASAVRLAADHARSAISERRGMLKA